MNKILKEFGMIILGCLIMALGTGVFLLPNKLSTGGFTGIATVLYYYMKFPVGTSIIIMNIPLFIIAYFKIRKKVFMQDDFCNDILFKTNRFHGNINSVYE